MYRKELQDGGYAIYNGSFIIADGSMIIKPSKAILEKNGYKYFAQEAGPKDEPGMDDIIQAVKKMLSQGAEQLSDEDALDVAAVFPTWASKMGKDVEAGERLWDDGKLWKVLQPHTVQANWRPADAPSLFAEVSIEEWPEWRQPTGAQDAYAKGDKVTHGGQHWVSDVDGNVWEPGVYGWTAIA